MSRSQRKTGGLRRGATANRLILLLVLLATWLIQPGWTADPPQRGPFRSGVLIHFDGPITPLLEQYFYIFIDTDVVVKDRGDIQH